ncbi:MAG: hypothetical protein ACRDRT_16580, partial [Pseudonocardiaceae bacterium]
VQSAKVAEVMGETPMAGQWLMDCLTHEHDLRAALGMPAVPCAESVAVASEFLLGHFSDATKATITLVHEGGERTIGKGEPNNTLNVSMFEFLRAVTGRRSVAQVMAMDWKQDPTEFVDSLAWGPFRPSQVDIKDQ